jgi:iron complex outermembrane recepter protein
LSNPAHSINGVVWLVCVNLLHAFAQNDIAQFETPTDGYNLLKAEVSYTKRLPNAPLGSPREFTVGVVGNNLLNEHIRNHVSYTKDEALMPGASVRAFANVKF